MIHTARYPFDLQSPLPSVTDYCLKSGEERCSDLSAPVLIDGPSGRTITYAELRPMIRACAAGLRSRGLEKGGVLAILAPNIPEYAIAFHATAALGAVVTTLNPLYTAGEIAHQLADSGATFLLTISAFEAKAREVAAAEVTRLERIYLFDGIAEVPPLPPRTAESPDAAHAHLPNAPQVSSAVPVTPFVALLADGDAAFPADESIDPSDLIAIPYSSGTSGVPKGVMLTHFNLVAQLHQLQTEHLKLTHEDTLVGVLPFFHIYGMIVVLNLSIVCGAKTVSMPKFDPPLFLEVLKKHSVTIAHVAPPIVGFLAKHPAVDKARGHCGPHRALALDARATVPAVPWLTDCVC